MVCKCVLVLTLHDDWIMKYQLVINTHGMDIAWTIITMICTHFRITMVGLCKVKQIVCDLMLLWWWDISLFKWHDMALLFHWIL